MPKTFESEQTLTVKKSEETGRYQVCMPDGAPIPLISRGSVKIESDPDMFQAGMCFVTLTAIVKLENINPSAQEEIIKTK